MGSLDGLKVPIDAAVQPAGSWRRCRPPGLESPTHNESRSMVPPLESQAGMQTAYDGTVLTPEASSVANPLRSPKKRAREAALMRAKRLAVWGSSDVDKGMILSTPSSPMRSPTKRAREAVLAKARKEGIPVKVPAPALATRGTNLLNPSLPAKKKPIYVEGAVAANAALQTLDPSMPVKKRTAPFLLENPPSVIPPEGPR